MIDFIKFLEQLMQKEKAVVNKSSGEKLRSSEPVTDGLSIIIFIFGVLCIFNCIFRLSSPYLLLLHD